MHAHSKSDRYKYITKSVIKAAETKKMMKAFDNDMERSGFFPILREKIRQVSDAKDEVNVESTAEMWKVCNYLHWMRKSNVPLKINLTEEEIARIEICKESRAFAKYCGFFEQPALLTYQFLEFLSQMKDVLYGARNLTRSSVLSPYLQ